jgi:hypothetical protein
VGHRDRLPASRAGAEAIDLDSLMHRGRPTVVAADAVEVAAVSSRRRTGPWRDTPEHRDRPFDRCAARPFPGRADRHQTRGPIVVFPTSGDDGHRMLPGMARVIRAVCAKFPGVCSEGQSRSAVTRSGLHGDQTRRLLDSPPGRSRHTVSVAICRPSTGPIGAAPHAHPRSRRPRPQIAFVRQLGVTRRTVAVSGRAGPGAGASLLSRRQQRKTGVRRVSRTPP